MPRFYVVTFVIGSSLWASCKSRDTSATKDQSSPSTNNRDKQISEEIEKKYGTQEDPDTTNAAASYWWTCYVKGKWGIHTYTYSGNGATRSAAASRALNRCYSEDIVYCWIDECYKD